jgi:signal transduction histidine kinase/CheY-like chemotaxis protein
MLEGYAYCRMLPEDNGSRDFVYLDVNAAFGRLTGLKNVVGRRVTEVIPGLRDSNPEIFEIYGRVASSGRPEWFETYVDSLGIWFSVSVHSPGKGFFVAVFENITERRKLEEQLRQSQKMEAVGRLAGGIAHDFNNLLTVINGYGELLHHRIGKNSALRKDVEEIRRAGDRAALLTRQLLAFSRRQVLQPKMLDLNELVANMEKMLRRLIGEDVELRAVLGPELGIVKADPGQIEQVIVNLVVNARDAMPGGGRLILETGNVFLDEKISSKHPYEAVGPHVFLAVSDTGVGMSEETQAHLFEPFFTTKEKGKGTGLGLSTVYGIVKQSQGYIHVHSEVGKGTTVRIFLPRADGEVETLSPVLSSVPQGNETVLVVEDEGSVRELVERVLSGKGYRVLPASEGSEGLRIAGGHQEPINLLITDVVMPGMGGCELANRLEAARPGMKVLFMSGYSEKTIHHQGAMEGGPAFLQKPFTSDALLRKVRETLDRA